MALIPHGAMMINALTTVASVVADERGPDGRVLGDNEKIAESQRFVVLRDGKVIDVSALPRTEPRPEDSEKVDSNALPKEEPHSNGIALSAAMQLDAAKLEFVFEVPTGKPYTPEEKEALDIVIASVLAQIYGKIDTHRRTTPQAIDDEFIRRQYGDDILGYTKELAGHYRAVDEAVVAGKDLNSIGIAEKFHDAIATRALSKLRLAVRTVGDGLFDGKQDPLGRPVLPTYENGKLKEIYGVKNKEEYLGKYLAAAGAAVGLNGVSQDIKEKSEQLTIPVLSTINKQPAQKLTGKYSVIATVHNTMDIFRVGYKMGHQLARVIGMYFDTARYLERSRRRDGDPASTHISDVCSLMMKCGIRNNRMLRAAGMHDTVEDTIFKFPVNLEYEDALAMYQLSDAEGERKGADKEMAKKFKTYPAILTAADIYDLMKSDGQGGTIQSDAVNLRLTTRANSDYPYSLEAAVVKIFDFADTMRSSLYAPHLMEKEYWNQSGKPFSVYNKKDDLIFPLIETITAQIDGLDVEKGNKAANDDLKKAMANGIFMYADVAKEFMGQNLRRVGVERGLAPEEVADLFREFFNPDVPSKELETKWADTWKKPVVAEGMIEKMAISLKDILEARGRFLALAPQIKILQGKGYTKGFDVDLPREPVIDAGRGVDLVASANKAVGA